MCRKKKEKKSFVKLHNILFYLGKGLGGFEAETISETNKHCWNCLGTKCHINSSSTGALKRGGRVVEMRVSWFHPFIFSSRGKKFINGQSFIERNFYVATAAIFRYYLRDLRRKITKPSSTKKHFKLRFDITRRRIFPTFYFFHRNHPEKKNWHQW